jgi:hypothetical protein
VTAAEHVDTRRPPLLDRVPTASGMLATTVASLLNAGLFVLARDVADVDFSAPGTNREVMAGIVIGE